MRCVDSIVYIRGVYGLLLHLLAEFSLISVWLFPQDQINIGQPLQFTLSNLPIDYKEKKKIPTSIMYLFYNFIHHTFIPITTPKMNPTENIQLSDMMPWIVFIDPGNFPSVESWTPVLLISSEIRFQWILIVTIPTFSALRERINSTARYTRTVYPMWKRIQTTAHPKTAPRIGCLIGWLTKLRGHVT